MSLQQTSIRKSIESLIESRGRLDTALAVAAEQNNTSLQAVIAAFITTIDEIVVDLKEEFLKAEESL